MNFPSMKVRELTAIRSLLGANGCAHYGYSVVLEHINTMLAPEPLNISLQGEQTLEKLFVQVFSTAKVTEFVMCNGCHNAMLIKEVLLKRTFYRSIISTLWKTLSSGEFTF